MRQKRRNSSQTRQAQEWSKLAVTASHLSCFEFFSLHHQSDAIIILLAFPVPLSLPAQAIIIPCSPTSNLDIVTTAHATSSRLAGFTHCLLALNSIFSVRVCSVAHYYIYQSRDAPSYEMPVTCDSIHITLSGLYLR
jgi:hypothetical protein